MFKLMKLCAMTLFSIFVITGRRPWQPKWGMRTTLSLPKGVYLVTCYLVTCYLATCYLVICYLATCYLATCYLATCYLVTCYLVTCYLVTFYLVTFYLVTFYLATCWARVQPTAHYNVALLFRNGGITNLDLSVLSPGCWSDASKSDFTIQTAP